MSFVMSQILEMPIRVFAEALEKEAQSAQGIAPAVVQKLEGLCGDLDKLEDCWSIMAGRNILADLKRQLEALEPLLTGDIKLHTIGLKKAIVRALEGHFPGKGRYTSALCVGWKVKTAWDSFQGQTDERQDMEAKATAMLDAIKDAVKQVGKHQDNAEMLKIFMAPEFYFRGKNGAYSFDDVNGLKGADSLATILRKELDKPDYKDWLFVLGTVIVAAKSSIFKCRDCNGKVEFEVDKVTAKSTPRCKAKPSEHTCVEVQTGATVDNVALIIKEKFVHCVEKELVSNKDFNARPGTDYEVTVGVGEGTNKVMEALNPRADKNPNGFTDERMGGAIFTFDGITFGCEICLDHATSTATKGEGRLDHAGNIQVQLIPSAGMTIRKFRTVQNGVIFNVDGTNPHVHTIGVTRDPKTKATLVQTYKTRGNAAGFDVTTNWAQMKTAIEANTVNFTPTTITAGKSIIVCGPYEIPRV